MGRFSYLIIAAACGVAACSEPSSQPSPKGANETAQIERPVALPCPAVDPNSACKADTLTLQADFDKALAGDYQAQRNTAYALGGASLYVTAQPVQACAWRKVIVTTRPAGSTYADDSQAKADCGKLSLGDQAAADQIAAQISARLAA